jgi:RNA polymerase sigma-70 factor (ECF subfamily)
MNRTHDRIGGIHHSQFIIHHFFRQSSHCRSYSQPTWSNRLTETDEALVLASQAGDRTAFEQLVRRTARLVHARLYLATGQSRDAEDLSQETFLVAWRSIKQVTDPSGFRSWLLSIARTVTIDATRREGRKKRTGMRMSADVIGQIPAQSPSPPEVVVGEESRQKVLALLRGLPEEYRLPLMLRYLSDHDYETIGRQLGLTNGSLRGLLNRGMTLLRERAAKAGLTSPV